MARKRQERSRSVLGHIKGETSTTVSEEDVFEFIPVLLKLYNFLKIVCGTVTF